MGARMADRQHAVMPGRYCQRVANLHSRTERVFFFTGKKLPPASYKARIPVLEDVRSPALDRTQGLECMRTLGRDAFRIFREALV
jgi:hypothetical protein